MAIRQLNDRKLRQWTGRPKGCRQSVFRVCASVIRQAVTFASLALLLSKSPVLAAPEEDLARIDLARHAN
jgi:hypothetical protein